jgi:hypothetical protein
VQQIRWRITATATFLAGVPPLEPLGRDRAAPPLPRLPDEGRPARPPVAVMWTQAGSTASVGTFAWSASMGRLCERVSQHGTAL